MGTQPTPHLSPLDGESLGVSVEYLPISGFGGHKITHSELRMLTAAIVFSVNITNKLRNVAQFEPYYFNSETQRTL